MISQHSLPLRLTSSFSETDMNHRLWWKIHSETTRIGWGNMHSYSCFAGAQGTWRGTVKDGSTAINLELLVRTWRYLSDQTKESSQNFANTQQFRDSRCCLERCFFPHTVKTDNPVASRPNSSHIEHQYDGDFKFLPMPWIPAFFSGKIATQSGESTKLLALLSCLQFTLLDSAEYSSQRFFLSDLWYQDILVSS